MCNCSGYEIALDPWRGGELVIQVCCFEQLKELADQSNFKMDLGKHRNDDCLCQLPAELVERVVGHFVMNKSAEGFAVTTTCPR
jgi:hypothetical protein